MDYGRIDNAVRDGRIKPWEINLNPTIGNRPNSPSRAVPSGVQPLRAAAKKEFYRRFQSAWESLDSTPAASPLSITPIGRFPADPRSLTLPPSSLQPRDAPKTPPPPPPPNRWSSNTSLTSRRSRLKAECRFLAVNEGRQLLTGKIPRKTWLFQLGRGWGRMRFSLRSAREGWERSTRPGISGWTVMLL